MPADIYWLVPSFFMVALVYSTVGFGGGSLYLTALAFSGLPYQAFAPIALICNIIVATSGFYHFCRAGHFSIKRVLPFVVTSIPFAYWGGTIPLGKRTFILLLGASLLVASLRLFFSEKVYAPKGSPPWKMVFLLGLPIGAILGFWSGLVGIGGGIFLAPLLLLLGWADSRQAACAASFFIVLNSISGLLGHLTKGMTEWGLLIPLGIAVFLGGQIGSRLGSHPQRMTRLTLQRVTAALILVTAARLLGSLW